MLKQFLKSLVVAPQKIEMKNYEDLHNQLTHTAHPTGFSPLVLLESQGCGIKGFSCCEAGNTRQLQRVCIRQKSAVIGPIVILWRRGHPLCWEFQVFHGWGDKLEIFTGRPGVSEGRCLSSNSEWELFDDIAGLGICHVTVARS